MSILLLLVKRKLYFFYNKYTNIKGWGFAAGFSSRKRAPKKINRLYRIGSKASCRYKTEIKKRFYIKSAYFFIQKK